MQGIDLWFWNVKGVAKQFYVFIINLLGYSEYYCNYWHFY